MNIEPGEKMFNLLQEKRPEDINLRVGVGKISGKAIFYEMDVDTVSTFNKNEAQNRQYDKSIISRNEIVILTLKDIFETYCKNKIIDFISIDVEGDNCLVLEGNDWTEYRPSYILIEMPGEERLKIIPYLYEQGYYLIFDNSLNGIFANSGILSAAAPINFEQCLVRHK